MTSLLRTLLLAGAASALLAIGACSTTPKVDTMSKLCSTSTKDLHANSQRILLAGGYYALKENDLACAERLTFAAQGKNPKDSYAALNLGAIYQRTGRLDMAKAEFAKAIALDAISEGDSETAQIATIDQAKSQRPSVIARENLVLMQQKSAQ
jgi:Flp pilus assembly protein TadD